MTYKVIFHNQATGDSFTSCRRFPTRDGADRWAATYAVHFASPMTWQVAAAPSPVDALDEGRGLGE